MVLFQIDKAGNISSSNENLGEGGKVVEDDDDEVDNEDDNEDEDIDEMVYGEDDSASDEDQCQTWMVDAEDIDAWTFGFNQWLVCPISWVEIASYEILFWFLLTLLKKFYFLSVLTLFNCNITPT